MIESLNIMIERLFPEDNTQDDTDHHMYMSRPIEQPIETSETENSPKSKSDY